MQGGLKGFSCLQQLLASNASMHAECNAACRTPLLSLMTP